MFFLSFEQIKEKLKPPQDMPEPQRVYRALGMLFLMCLAYQRVKQRAPYLLQYVSMWFHVHKSRKVSDLFSL